MSPREKANELVKKYIEFRIDGRPRIFGIALSKQFALIAVDEIIEVISTVYEHDWNILYPYWTEVKQEIEKI